MTKASHAAIRALMASARTANTLSRALSCNPGAIDHRFRLAIPKHWEPRINRGQCAQIGADQRAGRGSRRLRGVATKPDDLDPDAPTNRSPLRCRSAIGTDNQNPHASRPDSARG